MARHFLLFLSLLAVACDQGQRTDQLVFFTDSLASSRSDFVVYLPQKKQLVFRNHLLNQMELYAPNVPERQGAIYPRWHQSTSALMQSLTWVNEDTLLVLMRHTPALYYFDRYGHCYHKQSFGENYLTHFSSSVNLPYVHQRRLCVPLLPELAGHASPAQFARVRELRVDLQDGSTDTLQVLAPQVPNLLGLRHHLAVRTLVDDKLVYLWGHGGQLAIFDLKTRQVGRQDLPLEPLALPPFSGSFADNRLQQEYYHRHPVYDHLAHDPYRQRYYVFRLEPAAAQEPRHQRAFTIFVLDYSFKLVNSKLVPGGQYHLDHQAITEVGFFLMRQQTEKPNELVFEKIDFGEGGRLLSPAVAPTLHTH
jgi:hypothetical protein